MVEFVEDTKGKIRDLPVNQKLKHILILAGEAAKVDKIRVTSGGQCQKCAKRTGSIRHDLGNAADLEIWKNGKALQFTNQNELPFFEAFITAAAKLGATGVGAGIDYMGAATIHVGFGKKMVWGAKGASINAPQWLKKAAEKGWAMSNISTPMIYMAIARKGLNLRSGPGTEFKITSSLDAGSLINIHGFDGPNNEWGRVDLLGNGYLDGHVHKSYLSPVDDLSSDEEEEDCTDN